MTVVPTEVRETLKTADEQEFVSHLMQDYVATRTTMNTSGDFESIAARIDAGVTESTVQLVMECLI